MTISTLPAMPTRGSATFSADVEAFLAAMPNFVTEVNDFGAALNNLSTNGTSSTSLTIGTGSKSLTATTGKSWQLGMIVRLAYTTTPTNWMSGEVTAYNSSTGAMTVNVTATSGSGTYGAWTISAAAAGGATLLDIQSGNTVRLGTVVGTNVITATASPTLTAYTSGQRFSFIAAATNSSAVTLNIDGLGAKDVTQNGTVALRTGAIVAGGVTVVEYDGTRFQLISHQQRVTPGSPSGTGANCVAVSCDGSALSAQGTANNITAIGFEAGKSIVTGTNSTIMGYQAGRTMTTSNNNTFLGSGAGYANTTGQGNTYVGTDAGASATSGSQNTFIGQITGNGQVVTGSNNILIGYNAAMAAVSDANTATIGAGITTLRCGTTTITAISDQRDKSEIQDLDLGLPFLLTLRPRRFRWASRDGSHPHDGMLEAGFIAQELAAAQDTAGADYLGLVWGSNPEKLEASPGKLLPIIVQAIKDLAAENATLRARLAAAGIP